MRLEQLQGWNEIQSEKLSSSLQPGVALASRGLKHLMRLSSNVSVSKRGLFKQAYWMSFKRARDYGWGRALLECLVLSRDISAYCEGRVAVLKQNYFANFLRQR